MITSADLQFNTDENGLMLDDDGDQVFCDYCEAWAIVRRVVSVEKPHDDTRDLCHACDAAYMAGVQHGRFHEAARDGHRPGRGSSQEPPVPIADS